MEFLKEKVPISFEHKGRKYKGYFSYVNGAGNSSTFFLTVDGYHVGQLFNTDTGWRFYSNRYPELTELSEWFGEYVTLWYG